MTSATKWAAYTPASYINKFYFYGGQFQLIIGCSQDDMCTISHIYKQYVHSASNIYHAPPLEQQSICDRGSYPIVIEDCLAIRNNVSKIRVMH